MLRSRMIAVRSKPRLVWLWTMSAAGVSDGITRYVCSPGPNGRSARACRPAVVTMARRHAPSGPRGRVNGVVSLTCAGNVSRLLRLTCGRRSSRGIGCALLGGHLGLQLVRREPDDVLVLVGVARVTLRSLSVQCDAAGQHVGLPALELGLARVKLRHHV